jgi:hypothetical protein
MQKIAQLGSHPLKWIQPKALQEAYELRSSVSTGDDPVATLRFRSAFGTLARAESSDGCWTFKRVGFWQNKATVRACEGDSDLAVFKNNTWNDGGTLEFADGRIFKATTNAWMTRFEFQTETEQLLLRFKYEGVFRLSAMVEIQPLAYSLVELPLLVLFGWYLAVMLYHDSSAAVIAIV